MTATMSKPRGNRHRRHWDRAKVQEAIRRWEKKFGRPPTEADWNPARARFLMAGSQARVDRWNASLEEYATGNYPSSRTLQDMYDGKWAEGIKDAGFVPLPSGRPSRENMSRYVQKSDGVDEAALLLTIEEVRTALRDGTVMDKRRALLDLASVAASLAEEIQP